MLASDKIIIHFFKVLLLVPLLLQRHIILIQKKSPNISAVDYCITNHKISYVSSCSFWHTYVYFKKDLKLYLQSNLNTKCWKFFFCIIISLQQEWLFLFFITYVHYVGTVLNSLRFAIDEAVGCGNCVCYKFQSRNLWYICCFLSPACNHFPATKWTFVSILLHM